MAATYEWIDRKRDQRWYVPTGRTEMITHFAAKAIARETFGTWRGIGKGCGRLIEVGWQLTDGSPTDGD